MNDKTKQELANEERAKIAVDVVSKEDEKPVEELAKTNEKSSTEEEKPKEETTEEITETEKTEEDLEREKQEAKTAAEKARIQKRIDKEVGKRKALENELAELRKQIAARDNDEEPKLTKEDIAAEAKKLAEQEINNREFTNACNRLADAAKKADKDFDKKINQLSEDVAPLPGYMIGILDDLENGGEVLAHLASNLDEYEDVHTLTPIKMAVSLSKLSNKLIDAKKTPPKKISKVPEPLDKVKGNPKVQETLMDNEPMEDWIAKRNRQVAERQAQKRAGMR